MGGALVQFQDALYDVAREAVIKHPEVHGFGGLEVIDQQRIAEVVEQANNAFRMLHVHGLGLGMLILLVSIAIVNLPLAEGLKKALCVLVPGGTLSARWAHFGMADPMLGGESPAEPHRMEPVRALRRGHHPRHLGDVHPVCHRPGSWRTSRASPDGAQRKRLRSSDERIEC